MDKQAVYTMDTIEEKIDLVCKTLKSEEYKRAYYMLKNVEKMKKQIKEHCQTNKISSINGKEYKIKYILRKYHQLDRSLIPTDKIDLYKRDVVHWIFSQEKL
jgi:hypothetical protein